MDLLRVNKLEIMGQGPATYTIGEISADIYVDDEYVADSTNGPGWVPNLITTLGFDFPLNILDKGLDDLYEADEEPDDSLTDDEAEDMDKGYSLTFYRVPQNDMEDILNEPGEWKWKVDVWIE